MLKEWASKYQILFALNVFEIMTDDEWFTYYYSHCGDKFPGNVN